MVDDEKRETNQLAYTPFPFLGAGAGAVYGVLSLVGCPVRFRPEQFAITQRQRSVTSALLIRSKGMHG